MKFIKQNTIQNLQKLLELGTDYNEIISSCTGKGKLRDCVGIAKILLNSQKFNIGDNFGLIVDVDNKTLRDMDSQYRLRNIQKKIFKMADIIDCSFNCMCVENSKGEFDVEFRGTSSYGNLNVRQLADKYGGGGHYLAAGCHLSESQGFSNENVKLKLIKEAIEMFSSKESKKTQEIFYSDADKQLAQILEDTERLTKKVTPKILEKVDELYKNGANYDYLFKKLKTFKSFMLENEILSRVPGNVLMFRNPRVNITLKKEDFEALCKKYDAEEKDILNCIDVFSDIDIETVTIRLPSGKKVQIDKNGNKKIEQINKYLKEVDYKI